MAIDKLLRVAVDPEVAFYERLTRQQKKDYVRQVVHSARVHRACALDATVPEEIRQQHTENMHNDLKTLWKVLSETIYIDLTKDILKE